MATTEIPLAFQKRDRIPNRNSHLAQKHSLPHLRTSTASSHSEKDFWSGFSQDPRRESIERNTPTPVPFDDVVIPTVYRKLQEQSHEELCFDSEQQALEYERKLKATQKWYEAQQRRKNEALYSKQRSASVAAIPTPPPRQQPTPPEKAPIRTASVREARSPGMHHHGSSPSLATERRGRGSDAYPTPPSSGYYQKTTQFDDPTSPFAQSRPAEGSVLVPQRQAPMAPGENQHTVPSAKLPPPRPTEPAPALPVYPPAPDRVQAISYQASAPEKTNCCIIL